MKLIFSLFSKKLFLNILVAVQICASVVFGMISLSVMQHYRYYYDITSGLSESYFYSPSDETSYYDENSAVVRFLNEGKIELSRVQNNSWIVGYDPSIDDPVSSWIQCDYSIDNIYIVGSAVSEIMKPQLESGRWFSESKQDGEIECVIVGDESLFPLGTVLDCGELRYVQGGDESINNGHVITNNVKLRIVGNCGTSAEMLVMSAWTTPAEAMQLDVLFKRLSYDDNFFEKLSPRYNENDEPEKPSLTVICSSVAMYGSVVGAPKNASNLKKAIFSFTENAAENEKSQILQEMKNEASIVSVEILRENQLSAFRATLSQYIPLLICFTVLILVGVIGSSILNMLDNRNVFKTCIICGMSVRQGFFAIVGYTAILMLISSMLTALGWAFLSMVGVVPWSQMQFNGNCVMLAVIEFAISTILIFVVSVLMLKKYSSNGVEI